MERFVRPASVRLNQAGNENMFRQRSRRPRAQEWGKQTVTTIISSVDLTGPDRVFASTIRAIRRSLGATDARLSRASGISRQRIEAIETGVATTHAERRDITAALARLSHHRVAKALARRRLAR